MSVEQRAFTLIELLIVVAIIAILAAIAVPNFLEAQVRAKASRAKTDMRSIAVGIEAYTVDNSRGPVGGNEGRSLGLWDEDTRHFSMYALTSPVSYMTNIPQDPFVMKAGVFNPDQNQSKYLPYYTYQHNHWLRDDDSIWGTGPAYRNGFVWYLRSVGPDRQVGEPYFNWMAAGWEPPDNVYDASNGTVSYGDIYLSNKGFHTGAS